MNIETFGILAGAALSLLFAFVPGFKGKYEALSKERKQLVMLALLFLVVAGKFGLSCIGKDATFACTQDGAYEALVAFILAAAVNAGVYKATNYIGK